MMNRNTGSVLKTVWRSTGWLWLSTLIWAQPPKGPRWRYAVPQDAGVGTPAVAYLSDRQSGKNTIMISYMQVPPNMAAGQVNFWLANLPTRCQDLSKPCQLPLQADGKPRESITVWSLGPMEGKEHQGKGLTWVRIMNVHTSTLLIHDLPHIHVLSVDVGEPGQPKWLEFATEQLDVKRLGADSDQMLNKTELK